MSDSQALQAPALLTPAQVATRLSISRSRVYQWTTAGQLPSIKVGTSVRIHPHDLAQFLIEQNEAS